MIDHLENENDLRKKEVALYQQDSEEKRRLDKMMAEQERQRLVQEIKAMEEQLERTRYDRSYS
jgi:hypothetical protein